jgi:Phosphodiester glycosidase
MARASRQAIASYEERVLAYETRIRAPRHVPARAKAPRARAPAGGVRLRRVVILTTLLLLAAASLSFATTMLQPSNVPFGVRAVEWLRDNGAAGLVSKVEAIYYSANAPSTGGAALRQLPNVGVAGVGANDAAYAPPAIAPVISPPLPGEGTWHGTGPLVRGAPAVLVTTFRPDPNYPQMVAGVAWIDSTRAWVQLYPGRYEPPNSGDPAAQVPRSLQNVLLATFNSGFKLEDSHGGFVAFGHVYAPLQDGLATFVRLRDGTADVRAWTGGPTPGPQIEFARQNLPLIVDGGRLNPNLSDGPQWGATLGNAVRVWRSGVGVDARGNLIYAAADNQTATSLAQILQRAGAARAMELDINYEWVTFNFYGAFGAVNPAKLLSGMSRDVTRYLSPDDRDFFAVFARNA